MASRPHANPGRSSHSEGHSGKPSRSDGHSGKSEAKPPEVGCSKGGGHGTPQDHHHHHDHFSHITIDHTYKYIYRDGVFTTQYNHDGTQIALGFGDHGVEIVNASTGKKTKELCQHKYGSLGAMSVRYSPILKNRLLVATSEGVVIQYEVDTGTSKHIVAEANNEINCMDFSHDGTKFGTAGKDMDIRIYDARSARRTIVFAGYNTANTAEDTGGHAQRIFALKFLPGSSDNFMTGGWDNNLKVWDCRSPTAVVRIVSGPHIAGDGLDIKGNRILTGSWRSKDALQLFDLGSGKLIQTYPLTLSSTENQGEFLYCARFYGDKTIIAGGSGTQSLQAYDINSRKMIDEIKYGSSVNAVDVSKGRQFAFGGMGKEYRIGRLA